MSKKDYFYLTPYITCRWCNLVTYIDIVAVKKSMAIPGEYVSTESLQPCKDCGRADKFEIGHHDFSEEIRIREEEIMKRKLKEKNAVLTIQRSYRCYIRRMYGSANVKALLAEKLRQNKAATIINAGVRKRLACRRVIVEKCLLLIKGAHLLLLNHALRPDPERVKVFWYKRKEMLTMLYKDYVGLISRTGSNPPRNIVEENIKEIAKRIQARKNYLVNGVQRCFRGFLSRRIVEFYKVEMFYLMQWKISCIFKIQRSYRGHRARLKVFVLKADRLREKIANGYNKFSALKLRKKNLDKSISITKSAYIKEQAEERTARFTSRLELASNYDLKKTFAFSASVYADDKLPNAIKKLTYIDSFNRKDEDEIITHQRSRKKFIVDRIAEHGPKGFGTRGYDNKEISKLAEKEQTQFLKSLSKSKTEQQKRLVGNLSEFIPVLDDDAAAAATAAGGGGILLRKEESRRSQGMRSLFKDELKDLVDGTVQRIMHDFKKPEGGHLSRFQKYNELRKSTKLLEFKYPKNVNENPMDWLNDNIDDVVSIMDKKVQSKPSS